MLEQKFAEVIGALQVENILLKTQLAVAQQRIAELDKQVKGDGEKV